MYEEILENIKRLVTKNKYRITIHAVRHMIEEGFTEVDIVESIRGSSRILELYPEEKRCLILGQFKFTEKARTPLHIVCDYSQRGVVDIVTAYIPQRPWWISPTKRGKI